MKFALTLNLFERAQLIKEPHAQKYLKNKLLIKWWVKAFFDSRKNQLKNYVECFIDSIALLDDLIDFEVEDQNSFILFLRKAHIQSVENRMSDQSFSDLIEVLGVCGHEWLCRAFIENAWKKIHNSLSLLQSREININLKRISEECLFYFNQKLAQVMMPTIILEANISRMQNRNSKATPEERFQIFIRGLGQGANQEDFWVRYPALWRKIAIVATNCMDACVEILGHIQVDMHAAQNLFGIPKSDTLESITWEAGDPHRQGRAVAIFHFNKGAFVYKPKSLKVDAAYSKFIKWYSGITEGPVLSACEILDCGEHGYSSYITHSPCTSRKEMSEFYEKMGALIGVFWLLGGNDLHHENLIASGVDPYPIDLETLFDKQLKYAAENAYDALYAQCFQDLLFKIYLLPIRMLGLNGIIDISAIGAQEIQTADVEVLGIENMLRDDVRLALRPGVISKSKNSPKITESALKPSDFIEGILSGFEESLTTFEKNRSFLLAPDSVLNSFKGAPVRWIGRKTQDYADLIHETMQPTFLKDALECDMKMGELWKSTKYAPHLSRLIRSEVNDIWRGDVPYFWTNPESLDLFDSDGKVISDFFQDDGFSALKKRLENIHHYKAPQIEAIRHAIKSTESKKISSAEAITPKPHKGIFSKDKLVGFAKKIGDEIASKVHYVKDVPFWSRLSQLDHENCTARILPPTLYEGAPGIGLFFGYLYQYSHDPAHLKVAERSHALVKLLLAHPRQIELSGAYEGLAGLIYVDMHLSSLLKKPTSTNKKVLRHLIELIKKDNRLDIIAGTAGALVVCLRYFDYTGDLLAVEAAKVAYEKLVNTAIKQRIGMAWPTLPLEPHKFLGGLGHGVTGISWAISEWYNHTNDIHAQKIVKEAIAYEESLFDPVTGGWKDVRLDSHCTCAWCHGATGIGLVVSNLYKILDPEICMDIIDRAKKFIWQNGQDSDCLCHGSMGNLELYLSTGDDAYKAILNGALTRYEQAGGFWVHGLPGDAHTPSLMCGDAGIGYALLRSAYPGEVPSLLTLEIPKTVY